MDSSLVPVECAEDLVAVVNKYSRAYNDEVVYFIVTEDRNYVKIGTSRNASERLSELQTGNPQRLVVLKTIPGGHEKERLVHALWEKDRQMGEWFTLSSELLAWIHELNPAEHIYMGWVRPLRPMPRSGLQTCEGCGESRKQTDFVTRKGKVAPSCTSCRRQWARDKRKTARLEREKILEALVVA